MSHDGKMNAMKQLLKSWPIEKHLSMCDFVTLINNRSKTVMMREIYELLQICSQSSNAHRRSMIIVYIQYEVKEFLNKI